MTREGLVTLGADPPADNPSMQQLQRALRETCSLGLGPGSSVSYCIMTRSLRSHTLVA